MQAIMNGASGARTHCIRCGVCCKKGGPAFHTQDRHLIEDGTIHTRYLYTIRKGERVLDNVEGRLKPADTDIIKIKGKRSSWECVFYRVKSKTCSIYDHRPLECRLLKCWDTWDIESLYEKDRLTRRDILAGIEGLWGLITDHEAQCAHDEINRAIQNLDGPFAKEAGKMIAGAVQYDGAIRRLVLENGPITPDMVDFLFGRPLTVTLKFAGLTVENIRGVCNVSKK